MDSTVPWNDVVAGVLTLVAFFGALIIYFCYNLDFEVGLEGRSELIDRYHKIAPYSAAIFFVTIYGLAWTIDKSAIFA